MKEFEIRCDESRLEKNDILYGKFSLGPFLPGQGTTFGNALRRSLLSELSGIGITAFEILGVMQEFSTLLGLRESVLDLSLNLKQVVLTGVLPCSTPPIGFLKVRGPAVIHAADLKLPTGIYCVSPEQYIATLASNGTLNLKFLVSVGKGHLTQPYSLYRSLSKIKLQPTISSNLTNNSHDTPLLNDQWKNSLDSVAEFQSWDLQSSIEDQKNNKQSRNTIPVQSTVEKKLAMEMHQVNNGSPNLNSSDIVNNKSFSTRKLTPNKSNNLLMVEQPNTGTEGKEKRLDSFNSSNSVSYHNNVNSTNFDAFATNGKSLNSNSLGYTSIQKQLFQRINPHQVLPIDAIFTPVSQVNFLTQVNDRFETPRENVVLEIWTNGSIHPKRALEEAALSLVQNFDALVKSIQQASSFYKGVRYCNSLQSSNKKLINEFCAPSLKAPKPLHKALYNLDIGNLDLSLETFLFLKKAKIKTLSQLVELLQTFSSKEEHFINSESKNEDKKNVFLNKQVISELNKVVNQLGINLSL